MENEHSAITAQSTNNDKISLLIVFGVVTVLMIFLVHTENFAFGSEKGNWVYRYFKDIASINSWQLIIIFILLGVTIFIGNKFINKYETVTLIVCFLALMITQISIRNIYPVPMEAIVQSDRANGFYSVVMNYSAFDVLKQYHSLTSDFSMHVRANLPGKILLYEFFKVFTTSPTNIGYLIVAFSSLGTFLIYGICKKIFQDKQVALYAFVFYTLIPAKLFFFPILNTVTPVFMLLCLYLFVIYFEKKNTLFLWLLGIALFMLVLFDPSPLVTGLVFIGVTLQAIGSGQLVRKDFWKIIIIPFFAFVCVYLIFFIFFSFDLIQAFQFILHDATNFNLQEQRGYRAWFGENIKEFFYSAGTPILLIFTYQLLQILVGWKTLFKKSISYWNAEIIFTLSLLLTFSSVVFLGINRGEISRLWIYLAVLFQIPAAFFIAKIPKSAILFFITASVIVMQSIVALHKVGFVNP